ncbi:MAG: M28 family peptidase [Acidobacteria bacterium]|nr:M28 family peptidase [Acidobacteriota bacterium]
MKRVALFAVFLVLLAHPGAAMPGPVPTTDQLDRIVGMAMGSGFLRDSAVKLIDGIGPRLAGSANDLRAEALAEARFREAGVPLVRQEPVPVPLWQVHRATVTLLSPTSFDAPAVALANSASTPPQGLLLRIVDGGFGTPEELRALGDAVRGAAVLVRTGVPQGHRWMHRSAKYAAAAEAGAAVFLFAPSKPDQPIRSGTITLTGAPGPIPALSVSGTFAAWLSRLLERGVEVRARCTLMADRIPATAHNVVADIPGSSPRDVILVGAHLDSWDRGQGAGDNGLGTLVLWQVAKVLVDQGLRPRRTIRFVSFTGEELGLLGSRRYVLDHRSELPSIRAMINLDMVGDPTGFGTMLQPGLNPLLELLAARLAGFGLEATVPAKPGLYGDHQPFLLAGVPIVRVRSRIRPEVAAAYHSSADTFDTLDLGRQQRAAAVTAALVWALANVPELPTRTLSRESLEEGLGAAGIDPAQLSFPREADR